ncbi:replication initiation and membrane attachment protein DnaB [Dysgonomonas sp. PFB1-18]|uniref:hypothetical protein n=1 Tax=unclassified Dysgonomonas TaxID=2630389 RepID=UPI0024741907|nr:MULTISPECIES: hypothetical protein [unclassified Dysgonomonas]MDH6308032.1 replication initiation and membrane attachment protein DnaB [Dysgonomonas sp. PF1-14]MDH6339571.1 replication initiation and membrane attachment protein DnaB [Dysgonomonas sp. PF1-16]MDH6381222.1 replication initiation and membrane attachment protein DnaB [Dysgonomonas sp. PFB1-18]MDH6398434.1 replication initiation and membrane attachment protein DnaB [Dysgonomonas sp. PF1-23]
MNKKLFVKVKDLCKDTGLSEKYLIAITEKMGGSIEDDSTDEAAIEEVANQIVDIAKESQGEATRWANSKKKDEKGSKGSKSEKEKEEDEEGKGTKASKEDAENERLKALEEELALLKGDKAKEQRTAAVKSAQEKHKIPEWRMKGLVVPEDQDPDEYLAAIKQDLITQNLMPADTEGTKAASEQALDEVSDNLLESITVK